MARISTYDLDESVQATDKLLGSNAGGATKNFKIEDITDFLNTSGSINLNGVVEQFITQNIPLERGKFKLPLGGNGVAFSSITSLKVSTKNLSDVDVSEFYNHLVGQGLKISKVDNLNEFGQFVLISVTKANPSDTFATFSLSFLNGNGNLRNDNFYLFNLDNTGRTDKNFVTPNINFTAGTAHTVSHNLSKFPAVTTVDSAGSHIVGEVQHIDNNNFTITFKASFQGKVYVN
jgi:hypothetical protein